MKDTLENLFYFGLGSILMAKDKMDEAGESSRTFREDSERRAREFFERAQDRGSEEREQLRSRIKDLLKEAIGEMGLATHADIAVLQAEIARLRREPEQP